MYCPKCGNEVHDGEQYCTVCGYKLDGSQNQASQPSIPTSTADFYDSQSKPAGKEYSKVAAALLAFFLGSFGAHNFYLKRNKFAFIQLGIIIGAFVFSFLSGLLFVDALLAVAYVLEAAVGIWAFVDFILILCNKITPKDGYLK